MRPPIFLYDDGDLSIFDSPEAAARWVEAIDVERGEYSGAWDADGRKLRLAVSVHREARRWLPDRTAEKVTLTERDDSDPEGLLEVIRASANRIGVHIARDVSLEVAIERVHGLFRWSGTETS